VLLVSGTKAHVETLREEVAAVLAQVGLRLSEQKTRVAHIDEGFDFLGWRIQRHRRRGTNNSYVYTYPSKKALRAITTKGKAICWQDTNLPLKVVLRQLNLALRGWTTYFQPGVSHRTFEYLRAYTWRQVFGWLRRKHRLATWKELRRRHCPDGWWPAEDEVALFNPAAVRTTRYRYRGAAIPSPWTSAP
jgi:RNA-directed DNA polymerase